MTEKLPLLGHDIDVPSPLTTAENGNVVIAANGNATISAPGHTATVAALSINLNTDSLNVNTSGGMYVNATDPGSGVYIDLTGADDMYLTGGLHVTSGAKGVLMTSTDNIELSGNGTKLALNLANGFVQLSANGASPFSLQMDGSNGAFVVDGSVGATSAVLVPGVGTFNFHKGIFTGFTPV